MRSRRTLTSLFTLCGLMTALLAGTSSANTTPKWASASRARIHPGVQTRTPAGQCTSNFVFYDAKHTYIGQAAHCSSRGLPNETNGCVTGVLPLGTQVRIEGASRPGTIVYNSWVTMQKVKERSGNVCLGNDFALVRLDPADRARVNPSIPVWGGPTGIDKSAGVGELVYSYGDSSLRAGVDALSPKIGVATFDGMGGWTHGMYTLTPGIFGDSGSAVLGSNGGALGVLSTISLVPPAQNNASDLYRAFSYMKRHTGLDGVTLAKGTLPFVGL